MEVIVQELLRFIAGKFIAYINKNGVIVQELLRFIFADNGKRKD